MNSLSFLLLLPGILAVYAQISRADQMRSCLQTFEKLYIECDPDDYVCQCQRIVTKGIECFEGYPNDAVQEFVANYDNGACRKAEAIAARKTQETVEHAASGVSSLCKSTSFTKLSSTNEYKRYPSTSTRSSSAFFSRTSLSTKSSSCATSKSLSTKSSSCATSKSLSSTTPSKPLTPARATSCTSRKTTLGKSTSAAIASSAQVKAAADDNPQESAFKLSANFSIERVVGRMKNSSQMKASNGTKPQNISEVIQDVSPSVGLLLSRDFVGLILVVPFLLRYMF